MTLRRFIFTAIAAMPLAAAVATFDTLWTFFILYGIGFATLCLVLGALLDWFVSKKQSIER